MPHLQAFHEDIGTVNTDFNVNFDIDFDAYWYHLYRAQTYLGTTRDSLTALCFGASRFDVSIFMMVPPHTSTFILIFTHRY
jgi:hypothetical protein